ncbi:MAG TPA: hypothetical protein VGB90_02880 [Alphaproteobacteria bacterium]|jgi:hypothetical protein
MDATDPSPLDVLLAAMRALSKETFNGNAAADLRKLKLVSDIAKAAAPYVHPRCGTGEAPSAAAMRHEDRLKELE